MGIRPLITSLHRKSPLCWFIPSTVLRLLFPIDAAFCLTDLSLSTFPQKIIWEGKFESVNCSRALRCSSRTCGPNISIKGRLCEIRGPATTVCLHYDSQCLCSNVLPRSNQWLLRFHALFLLIFNDTHFTSHILLIQKRKTRIAV